jgi:hypothetical protein
MRPAVQAPAPVTVTQTAFVSEAEVQQRIKAAVDQAVDLKTKDLMKELQSQRMGMMVAVGQLEQVEKRMKYVSVTAANYGIPKDSIQ